MRSRKTVAIKLAKLKTLCGNSRLIWAAVVAIPALARGQSNTAVIGLPQLLAVDPALNGSGVRVGQAEANFGSTPYLFEVNPAAVGQPASLFTYTDQYGNVSNTFSPANESWHGDTVGGDIYGASTGVAPGVSHVDNYSADNFYNSIIFWDKPIPDAIVNQSFGFGQSAFMSQNISNQQSSDTSYDNYIDEYGTIIISAAGNGGSTPYPLPPSTNYNGIAVGVDNGPSAVGPTIDNGRSKPDITAPGNYTSFSTALVTGSAAVLVQAARRGDGGTSAQTEAAAADSRTIKALLLNGADKQAVKFYRTHTAPLDPSDGAGLLNVYNSYEQLAAGDYAASSQNATLILGGAHAPDVSSPAINSLSGWNFATIGSSLLTDVYANYVFQLPSGVTSYNLTSTLVWNRPFNSSPVVPIGINNLDLYLYDTTANTLVDYSTSAVDNVQDLYDTNLTPGHRYDLEVFKNGGVVGLTPGLVTYNETYALAFNFTALQSVWNLTGGGVATNASAWLGSLPVGAAQTASFDGSIQSSSTVSFNSNWVVGNINFHNSNYTYNIVSSTGGPLVLDNGGATATSNINDNAGTHAISAPVQLNSNLSVTVANVGDTLNIGGNITDNAATGGASVTINGNGTLFLGGVNTWRNGTTVGSGALAVGASGALPAGENLGNNGLVTILAGKSASPVVTGKISGSGKLKIGGATAGFLQLAHGSGTSSQSSIAISSGSTLDITNNAVAINFGAPAADPVATISAALASGYAGGAWTGTGINSSSAAALTGGLPVMSVGYADGNNDPGSTAGTNQILIKYAPAGDANLDGVVNVMDLAAVVQNLGKSGRDWAHGNFNYSANGMVTFADLVMVVQNFNRAAPPGPVGQAAEVQEQTGMIVLPEPGAAVGGMIVIALLSRRKRRAT